MLSVIVVPDVPSICPSCVYYPLWLVRLKVSWRRLVVSTRTEELWVCVDGAKGTAYRVDGLPETMELDLPMEELLPVDVDRDTAVERARELTRSWARSRLFCWWPPVCEVQTLHLIYKPYVIEKDGSTVVRDTLTGDSIEV